MRQTEPYKSTTELDQDNRIRGLKAHSQGEIDRKSTFCEHCCRPHPGLWTNGPQYRDHSLVSQVTRKKTDKNAWVSSEEVIRGTNGSVIKGQKWANHSSRAKCSMVM